MASKLCSKCKKRPRVTWKTGSSSYCRECRREYTNAHNKKHYQRKKPEYRARFVKWKYGLSLEQYAELYTKQGGKCAICGIKSERALAVDHDHTTGAVRGLLCKGCNTGLGNFGDDVEKLRSAIRYLGDR